MCVDMVMNIVDSTPSYDIAKERKRKRSDDTMSKSYECRCIYMLWAQEI